MRTRTRTAETPRMMNGTSTQFIRADHIRIDPESQRALRPTWVRWLAENWNPSKQGIIHVSRRRDAFYAIDGQHRVFAVRLRNEPEYLFECKVYEDLDKPEEANIFDGLNTTKQVRLFDKFRVSLLYDPDAQAIEGMVASVGLKLSDQGEDGNVNAVKALQDVYYGRLFRAKDATPWALAKTLRTLTDAWGTNRDAVSGVMIQAVGAIHLRYGDELDAADFARKLARTNGPIWFVNQGKIRRELTHATVWKAVAEVMVDVYNKGRRKNILPAWK